MKLPVSKLILFPMIILVCSYSYGHHGLSRFDAGTTITLQGNILRVEWVNPHVSITIRVVDEAGKVTEWEVEGPPPAMLARVGWSRETLRAGSPITASGNPTKSPSNLLYGTNIQPIEGMEFDQSQSISVLMGDREASESDASSLEGLWLTLLSPTQLAIYSGQGAAEGLTDGGRAALRAFDESTMNPGVDCVRNPAPASMVMPDLKKITFEEDVIVIESNYDNARRVIRMESDSVVEAIASNQGYSLGRWEGDTLVIETSHFSDHAMGNKWGVPSGPQKYLREEITLNTDTNSISYSYELSDPEFLTEVISGTAEWVYRPEMEFVTFECDIEAARRFLQ